MGRNVRQPTNGIKGAVVRAPSRSGRSPVAVDAEEALLQNRIRAWLRYWMAEHHINQTDLARRVQLDTGNISRYLSGERKITTYASLMRICRGIHLTPSRLLGENPPASYFEGDEIPAPF